MSGWRGYGLAILAIAAASGIVALVGSLNLANASLVYLGAVLVVAVFAGRGPSVATAIGSFAAVNYLFTEPRFTFAVTDPDALLGLFAFLVVAVVTSQLAGALRDRAVEATEREREARLLHDMATLLATRPLNDALEGICQRLLRELPVAAVSIDLGESGIRRVIAGDAAALREARSGAGPTDVLGPARLEGDDSAGLGRWQRVARPHGSGARPAGIRHFRVPLDTHRGWLAGSLDLLAGAGSDPDTRFTRIVATVAGQVALAADQERLRRAATEAEVLRRTDDLRGRLLDALSHDLRTPLASIIAAAGSLQQTDVTWTDDDIREFASAIEQEAERLSRIVGNLLDLGRIRDGTLVPAREWQDPAIVLEDAVERLRTRHADREITLDTPAEMSPVLLDAVEIDQVLANLVENAANASVPGEPILVSAEVTDGELRVAVDDHGAGLPPGPPERLFDPFVRGAPGMRGSGTGLGLAVARGLILAHGGRIWGENRVGGGARFAFALPASPIPELDAG